MRLRKEVIALKEQLSDPDAKAVCLKISNNYEFFPESRNFLFLKNFFLV